jgi:TolB-like protein/tetratricopeptide (TPR) repeat protein
VNSGQFLSELRRRRVLRVVGAYAIAAWLVVESYTTVHPILVEGLEWTDRWVVLLALLGFPITFALAWIFDITPDGVQRTPSLEQLAARPEAVPATAAHGGRRLTVRAAGFFGLGILVALASLAAYAGYQHGGMPRLASAAAPVESIAVLPFVDMSADHDQEYFADGVTEELLNRLARVPELRVAARTSSFAFKGAQEDVREIGTRLGVKSVLEGSVRRDGERLRVSAKLVDVATGYQLWADSFEGAAHGIFDLQDEIATAVVDALRHHLTPAPEAGQRGTASVRAYELYLLGMKRWHLRGDRELRKALDYFRQAVDEDPDFALAWAGVAQTYAVLPVYGEYPADSAIVRGSSAAATAIAKDPSLADAYAAMGQIVQNFERDLHGAESYYRRALRYQPNHATAHQWYAETLMLMGRYTEAAQHVERVLEADPLSPTALYVDAYLKMLLGRSDEALATWREVVRLHPDFTLGLLHHALAAADAGRNDEAARSVLRLAEQLPARAEAYRAIAAALQRPVARGAALQALRGPAAPSPSERAAWFMVLGDGAAALRALEQGLAGAADANLAFIAAHPLMRPLHGDTTFRRIAGELDLCQPG